MKLIFALMFSAIIASPAQAHDFWLEPLEFAADVPTTIGVEIRIGHTEDRLHWPTTPERVISFTSFGPGGITDQQASISRSSPGQIFPVHLATPGAHMLSIESTQAISNLEPEKFNAYVEEEGITPIRQHRTYYDLMQTRGKELYSRRGKSILQIGPLSQEAEDYITQPLGLTLEIIPEVNPLRLTPGDPFVVQVRYRGSPIAGATIHIVDLNADSDTSTMLITGIDGRASLPRPTDGQWMLHTIWSTPIFGNENADYDTTFSSLSFGFDDG